MFVIVKEMQGSIDNSTGATRVQSLFTKKKEYSYVQNLTFTDKKDFFEVLSSFNLHIQSILIAEIINC